MKLLNLFNPRSKKNIPVILLDENFNGHSIRAQLKQVVYIELENSLTNRFAWIPTKNSLLHFDEFSNKSNNVFTSFYIKPNKTGKGVIKIHYLNPNQPTVIKDTFTLRYLITKSN